MAEILRRCEVVKEAVFAASEPMTSPEQRKQAYMVCEEFKESLLNNTEVLLRLLDVGQPAAVRRYALQMMEHLISHLWNQLDGQQRLKMKSVCLDLMSSMSTADPSYLYESISRCIIEIVKRDWPQNWPTFLDDMSQSCDNTKPHQTQLVMRVLRRLSEDVIELNTIPSNRRKDIQTALNLALPDVLPALMDTLEETVNLYHQGSPDSKAIIGVALSSLETISSYVCWCDSYLLSYKNHRLIQLLYQNICDPVLSQVCVECLLVITQRHGNLESVSPVLVMFNDDHINLFLQAARLACSITSCSDYEYNILKRLSQLAISMGSQLISIWSKKGSDKSIPPTFPVYLETLLEFTKHSSLLISCGCFEFWATLMRSLSNDKQYLKDFYVKLSEVCLIKLQKVGSPAHAPGKDPAVHFSKLDFESEADWLTYFHKNKAAIVAVLQLIKEAAEQLVLDLTNQILSRKILETRELFCRSDCEVCDTKSDFYIEWEAVNVFHHSVCKTMTLVNDSTSLNTLQTLVEMTTPEPQVMSVILSAMSAFLPVVQSLNDMQFNALISKIFSLVQYKNEKFNSYHGLELVRHAAAVFSKFSSAYSHRLSPLFEELHSRVLNCHKTIDKRSYRLLLESLLVISEQLKNYDMQVQYINIVMGSSVEGWKEMSRLCCTPKEMAKFIGLMSSDLDNDGEYTQRHYKIQELLRDLIVVTKKVTVPKDLQESTAGGYTQGNGLVRSPVAPVLMPILDSLLLFLSSTLQLYHPDLLKLYPSGYEKAFELPQAERMVILGLNLPEGHREVFRSTSRASYIQKHVLEVVDSIVQVISGLSKCCPNQFFDHPNILEKVVYVISPTLEHTHMFTLRVLIRSLLKPLVVNCPDSMKCQLITTLMDPVIYSITTRLNKDWEKFVERSSTRLNGDDVDSEDPTDDEIIRDELLRVCSREFLTLCHQIVLEFKTDLKAKPETDQEDIAMSDGMVCDDLRDPSASSAFTFEHRLSSSMMSAADDCLNFMLYLSCISCCWVDSQSSQKSLDMIPPLFYKMFKTQTITADVAGQVLEKLLHCCQVNGQHEALCNKTVNAILFIYVLARPSLPILSDVMLRIPGVTQQKLASFEKDIRLSLNTQGTSNTRKEMGTRMKKSKLQTLISSVIGKNISEQFKDCVTIKDLPPLAKRKVRYSDLVGDCQGDDTTGLCQLFSPD